MSDKDHKHELSGVQADHNSMAVSGGIVVQNNTGSTHIGNTIINNYGPEARDLIQYKKKADFEPETIYIQEGPFLFGSQPGVGFRAYEYQQHEVRLSAYRIGQYPVTNYEYGAFISANKTAKVRPEMGWIGRTVPSEIANHPVVGVTFYDALAYCRWLTKVTKCSFKYLLPNEAQWEKAARGYTHNLYPWGNELDQARSNFGCADLAPVDAYKAQNDLGIHDMVGNVRQWTISLWGEKFRAPDEDYVKQPWKNDGRNSLDAPEQVRRVVKGSSFQDGVEFLRCSARDRQLPNADPADRQLGFRVVMVD
jgi:iron(II)-dependent oxidoreductase